MWWDEAACLGLAPAMDAETDERPADRASLIAAARVCMACPVRLACLADALCENASQPPSQRPVGVRGGVLFNHGNPPKPIVWRTCRVCAGAVTGSGVTCSAACAAMLGRARRREADLARLDATVPVPLIPAQRRAATGVTA